MNKSAPLLRQFFLVSTTFFSFFTLVGFSHSALAQSTTLDQLKTYLAQPAAERKPLAEQAFATAKLSKNEAAMAQQLLWDDRKAALKEERAAEMKSGVIKLGDKSMKFFAKTFGDKPASGHSLIISMHGGGGAPARVNDQQWENQKRLYEHKEGIEKLKECIYVAPRAPTNTWNLWHEPHIDDLFDRLIENMILLDDVDPNRVYITGYSAGGDGVYQLAPRMADRLASAAMMAGHPNESSPLGLRNLPFAIHVGEKDNGYKRNEVAKEWEQKLNKLHADDPDGYNYVAKLHAGKGHWMDREDSEALPWMFEYTRQPFPKKVVWFQDDITHDRFYWLAINKGDAKTGQEIVATIERQLVTLKAPADLAVSVRLNDQMLDLDQPLQIALNGAAAVTHQPTRTIATLAKTLAERGDPVSGFSYEVTVK